MKEIMPIDFTGKITMNSIEANNLINRFRKEEGKKERPHKELLKIIRREVLALETVGIANGGKFTPVEYVDEKGEKRPMYQLGKFEIMMLANRESALVRYRTQEYIEALENRLQTIQQQQIIDQKDKQIKRLEALIGLRTQHKFEYGKLIKRHLGIKKTDKDYEAIKLMFFYELGVDKWEDITYDRQNVILLNSICETYKPSEQLTLL